MKILCVSDQIDPLVYSSSAKERFEDIDLVLCAGDLAMEYVDYIVSALNKPTYFVFGNHNLKEFCFYHPNECPQRGAAPYDALKYAHGAHYLGFKTFNDGKLLMAGASGSKLYNNGQCQYTDKQMKYRLIKMIPQLYYNKWRYGRYLDIFLTHTPPKDIHDKSDPCHQGFDCYRWFLKKFKPTYMIHGHIHLYDIQDIRVSKFEETTIINAFSHYILEFDEKDLMHSETN
ncbi:MAG: metallophosphoesterase [Treponemataceae bacterium]|nr:metallophosphoesterase [Treponemataceae bacterium]